MSTTAERRMTTACNCSLCGKPGYWGRFGGHLGLYVRSYEKGLDRIGWICKDCREKLAGVKK